MTSPRPRAALCLSALALCAAAAAAPAPGLAAGCKSGDLGYQYRDGTATFSVEVTALKATGGAGCKAARKIAKTTALALLFDGDVPRNPQGFALKLDSPCASCPPRWSAVATKGKQRVTFTVRGGA